MMPVSQQHKQRHIVGLLVLFIALNLVSSACVTQETTYKPLVAGEYIPSRSEAVDAVSEQAQRLSKLVADEGLWQEYSQDILLALQAQELEDQGRWETSAQKWLTVLQMDNGVLASQAFEHWVQTSDKVVGPNTSSEVLARLLLSQTKDGTQSAWLQKQKLTKLERLTERIDTKRSVGAVRMETPALPADPSAVRDDPFLEKAAQLACKKDLPPSWQKWLKQQSRGRRSYWEGLMAFCEKNYEAALVSFRDAISDLEGETKAAGLVLNAADRFVQAQKRLGRREEAAAAYRLQHKLLLNTTLNPATVGWSNYELLKRQAEAGLWVGRMQSLLGDYENARIAVQKSLDLINRGLAAIPDLTKVQRTALEEQKADAYHILASRIAYEQKNYLSALSMVQVAQGLPEIGQEWKDRLKWNEGWYKYLLGDRPQAITAWKQLLNEGSKDKSNSAKILYWIGRAHEELGETGSADEYFKQLKSDSTLSFYHVVGVSKLRSAYRWSRDIDIEEAFERLKSREDLESTAFLNDPEAMRRLVRAELVQAANVHAWIKPLSQELYRYVASRDELMRDVELSLYVSKLLHMAGLHQQVIALSSQIAERRTGLWEDYPEQLLLCYPRPFEASYQRMAGQNYLEPELALAISRQESSFQAEAYSPAEAVGLMQLIAPTAQRQASRMGIKLDSPLEDLKRPNLNISLGTSYLAELGRRYKGQWHQAFAAYNAGEYVVDAWIQRRAAEDPVLWIEGLSFGETSSYAKNVWRNWEVYRMLKASR